MKKTDKIDLITKLYSDATSMFQNIEWNMRNMIGLECIIERPQICFLQNTPNIVKIDYKEFNLYQCLGLSLNHDERKFRINEIISSIKRNLICESLEITADILHKVHKIHLYNNNPYEIEEYLSINIKDLWNKNKSGKFLSDELRIFIENVASPLRNYIRHNNGLLPPKKFIKFKGVLFEKSIEFDFKWKKDSDNYIKLDISEAHDVFKILEKSCINGIKKALE